MCAAEYIQAGEAKDGACSGVMSRTGVSDKACYLNPSLHARITFYGAYFYHQNIELQVIHSKCFTARHEN